MKRPYSRETHYPAQIKASIPAALREAIDAEAETAGTSASTVIRDALARGLPLVRDARRKSKRYSGRQ